jgi:hypothetical protein
MKPASPGDLNWRELLLWCAPALILGAAIRLLMEIRMPYGYIQFDSGDFLLTPYRLLADHHYAIDSKKAFLTPTFFTIPFLLHIPALIFIPIIQHLMGLVEVVIAGALFRLWFPLWRWIIIPATTLIAISPWQLWYEHTLMGEANYVFFIFLVPLLGTLWARRPTWKNFAWFALSLFCICGTRAEGKIILLFGLALIPLVLWPQWKPILIAIISLVALYEIASLGGGGSHAFSLLYATLFKMTPDDIRSEPGTAPYLLPLRDQTIHAGENEPTDLVALAKQINDAVARYLREKEGNPSNPRERIAVIERHLSVEILKRRPLAVILTPFVKFQLASDGWPSGSDFGPRALLVKQPAAVHRLGDEVTILGPGLTGQKLDQAGLQQFVLAHYDPARMAWFNNYERAWSSASIALRLPDRPAPEPRWAHDFISMIPNPQKIIPGIPVYFLLAWAGMLAAILIPTPMRLVQTTWIAAMLFTWYAATMVGVTNARFRFAYDPFCYAYAVAALVWAGWGISRLFGKSRATSSSQSSILKLLFISIGVLCLIAGVLITWHAMNTPIYTDPSAPDRLSDELYGPIQTLDSREREWFRRLPAYETRHKKLFDLGTGLASCGLGLLAAGGWIHLYLRHAKLRTVRGFLTVWVLLWAIQIPALFWYYGVRLFRQDYPGWADSIAIPIFGDTVTLLIGALGSTALLKYLLGRRSFPLRLDFEKPASRKEWMRDIAIGLWLLILILLVGSGIVDGDIGLVFSCIVAWVMLAIVLIAPVKIEIESPVCITS